MAALSVYSTKRPHAYFDGFEDVTVIDFEKKIISILNNITHLNQDESVKKLNDILNKIKKEKSYILQDPNLSVHLVKLINYFANKCDQYNARNPLSFHQLQECSINYLNFAIEFSKEFIKENPQNERVAQQFDKTLKLYEMYAESELQYLIDIKDINKLKGNEKDNPLVMFEYLNKLDLNGAQILCNYKFSKYDYAKILLDKSIGLFFVNGRDLETFKFLKENPTFQLVNLDINYLDKNFDLLKVFLEKSFDILKDIETFSKKENDLLNYLHIGFIKFLEFKKEASIEKKIFDIIELYRQKKLNINAYHIKKIIEDLDLIKKENPHLRGLIDLIKYNEDKVFLDFFLQVYFNKFDYTIINKFEQIAQNNDKFIPIMIFFDILDFLLKNKNVSIENKNFFSEKILFQIDKLLSRPIKTNTKISQYAKYAITSFYKFIRQDYLNDKANKDLALFLNKKKPIYLNMLDSFRKDLSDINDLQILVSCYLFLEENQKANEVIMRFPKTDQFFLDMPNYDLKKLEILFFSKDLSISFDSFKIAVLQKITNQLNVIFKTAKTVDFDKEIFQRAELKIEQLKRKHPFLNNIYYKQSLFLIAVHTYLKLTQEFEWDDEIFAITFKISSLKMFHKLQRAFCLFCDYNFDLTTDIQKLTEIKI